MARLTAKYTTLPTTWPGRTRPSGWKPAAKSPFKVKGWSRIEEELLREVELVNGRDVTIALDIRNPGYFRQDGRISADARPATSRVIVAFTRPDGRRLTFPCDAYGFWQENVWAIRLSLEALRSMDRHGVTAGDRQYEGFAALPPAGGSSLMSLERAWALIAELSGFEAAALAFPAVRVSAMQKAKSKAHPDNGGSAERFQELTEAIKVVEANAGSGQ